MSMNCLKCGLGIDGEVRYCSACGLKVESLESDAYKPKDGISKNALRILGIYTVAVAGASVVDNVLPSSLMQPFEAIIWPIIFIPTLLYIPVAIVLIVIAFIH